MVQVINDDNEITIRFSKTLMDPATLTQIMKNLEIEDIAQRSQITRDQAYEIANLIKSDYWDENKEYFMTKINK